jgi:hypothetical protein
VSQWRNLFPQAKTFSEVRGHYLVFTRGDRGRGLTSVLDPDPYVFGPPGSASGSVSPKYGSGSVSQRYRSEDPNPHPDPYHNVTDQEHRAY